MFDLSPTPPMAITGDRPTGPLHVGHGRGAVVGEALAALLEIVGALECGERRYLNTAPYGEPRLSKRGLFRPIGGAGLSRLEEARLWALNLADGSHTVLDMAERSRMDFQTLRTAIGELTACGLLQEIAEADTLLLPP